MRDFRGGTVTVSNLGPLGSTRSRPEVAILGVGRIGGAVVPDESSDAGVTTERRLTLDLSFDHRVVDGADAARVLGTLAERLADAERYAEPP
jgi:pyruvate dehydrogenase E2 component (dihydrolipoamide acetyltransferase)